MRQNKGKKQADHYFDPRVLENYCRNDVLLTFEIAGRQAGRRIAKGESKMERNDLQAMRFYARQLQKVIF